MTVGDVIGIGLLVLVLIGFWLMGRHWSRVPPKPKPPRKPSNWRTSWYIGFPWTLR